MLLRLIELINKMKRKLIHQLNIIKCEISFLLNYLQLRGDNRENYYLNKSISFFLSVLYYENKVIILIIILIILNILF